MWPEMPGHGQAPRVAPNVEAYATALEPGLPERFVVGGHSLGGMVAMTLAARQPEKCRGLVLLDAPLRLPAWLRRWPALAPVFGWPRPLGFALQYRTSNKAMRPAVRRTIAATPRDGLLDAVRAALTFDGRKLLDRLTMPVLSLLGAKSLLTGPQDAIGVSKTYQAGHLLPFDRPEEVAQDIHGFLERHA